MRKQVECFANKSNRRPNNRFLVDQLFILGILTMNSWEAKNQFLESPEYLKSKAYKIFFIIFKFHAEIVNFYYLVSKMVVSIRYKLSSELETLFTQFWEPRRYSTWLMT
jgi:hypothetical protein